MLLAMSGSYVWVSKKTNLHLTLAHSKGDGRGHVQFDNEYLRNGDR